MRRRVRQPIDICNGPILPGVVRYTLPIIASGILQLLFNAADLVVVGRYCGGNAIAAVGATGSLVNLIVTFFFGLSVGAGVSVAQAVGAGDQEDAHHVVHTAIPTAVVSGVFLTVLGFVTAPHLLTLMQTPAAILPNAALYMRIYFLGMVPNIMLNFGSAILRAVGDTKRPLYYLSLAGVLNVMLNLLFVIVFHMGVAGVAVATILAQALSCALILRNMTTRPDECRLVLSEIRFYKRQLFKILRIGVPSGVQGILFSSTNVILQSSINLFGETAVSGSAAAANIGDITYIAMNAFSQTTLNYMGQNLGAKRIDRIGKIIGTCSLLVALVGLAIGLGVTLFGRQLLSIYIVDSEEAIQYGMLRLWYVVAPYFLCGVMEVTTGALRGLGHSFAPMITSILGVCVFRMIWIATVFQIPRYHSQITTVFVTWPISWIMTLTAQFILFAVVYARLKRSVAQE